MIETFEKAGFDLTDEQKAMLINWHNKLVMVGVTPDWDEFISLVLELQPTMQECDVCLSRKPLNGGRVVKDGFTCGDCIEADYGYLT